MNKTLSILLIAASASLGAGAILLGVTAATVGFDFTRLSASSAYEYQDYESAKSFSLISVDEQNAAFKIYLSSDEDVHINYGNNNREKYVFTETYSNLTITVDYDYHWFDVLNWFAPQKTLSVYLPSDFAGQLVMSNSNGSICAKGIASTEKVAFSSINGSIEVDGLSAKSLTVHASNGAETIKNSVLAESLEATDSNGSISVSEVVAPKSATLSSSNGNITVDGLTSDAISISDGNGHESVKNVISSGSLSITNSNGWIGVSSIDVAKTIVLTDSNGSINGDIKGMMSDYSIVSQTSNGSNNLPSFSQATTGSKSLNARTSNGSIYLTFVA